VGKLDDLKDHSPRHISWTWPSEVLRNRQIGTTNTAGIPFWTAGYQLDFFSWIFHWILAFCHAFQEILLNCYQLPDCCQRAVSSSPSSPWHQVEVITSSDSETGQSDSFWSCDSEFLLQFSEVNQFSTVFYSFLQFSTVFYSFLQFSTVFYSFLF